MLTLLEFPEDILVAICALMDPRDFLSLKQTCRVLHAFCSTDYVWHQMHIDLPLDLRQFPIDDAALSASDLQRSLLRALRLENNWQKEVTVVRSARLIPYSGVVLHIQILGPEWLATLSRREFSTWHLSVWHVPGAPAETPSCVSTWGIPATNDFTAILEDGGKTAKIAVVCGYHGVRYLRVYTVCLSAESNYERKLILDISQAHTSGILCDVCVSGYTVAAMIVKHTALPDASVLASYEILICNTRSNKKSLLALGSCIRIKFTLCPNYIIFGSHKEGNIFTVFAHALPEGEVLTNGLPQKQDLGPAIMEYQIPNFSSRHEFRFTSEPYYRDPSHIAIMTFYSPSRENNIVITFTHVPLKSNRAQQETTHSKHNSELHLSHMITSSFCMGKTARRAVWFNEDWNGERSQFMKISITEDIRPTVKNLVPLHFPLPFDMNQIISLCFDEALGRLCIGLYSEGVFIMDF